tara:strand:+ start:90 stop:1268 length:1179 start_codon:yes stop_codon:yes gene_type:complete
MSNYIKTTNFTAKDSLPSGNPSKIVRGTEIDAEFDAIAVASATKLNALNPVMTGTLTVGSATLSEAELEILDGATVTTTELNYVDGVTSSIQTQLNNKLSLSGGAMTGAITTNSTFDGVDIAVRDSVLTSTTTTANAALPKTGGAMTGAITTNSTFDGVDIATRDGVLSSTTTTANAALPKTGGAMTGAITTNSTFDGVDIATRDGVLSSTTTTANAALPKSGGAMTGAITTNSTFDGVDIATRDGVLTTTTNTANAALPKAGGAMTGAITTNSTFDGRDVATDGTKLDGIEASADVTDATNVTAAGALMDSELTNLAAVKAINQSLVTTATPTFAEITSAGDVNLTAGASDWAFTVTGNNLIISYGGTSKAKLDTSGNLIVIGNVTAYGSI